MRSSTSAEPVRETSGAPADSNGTVPRAAALAQAERIIISAPFRSSRRCSAFLRYIVEHGYEGDHQRLKERSLGVEVFHRDPGYDTSQDPVVRSTAGEVRKRLAQYYLEPGHEDELRISLRAGSYQPLFHLPEGEERQSPARRLYRSRVFWAILALVAAIVATFAAATSQTPSALDLFWAPVLESPNPILLCVGQHNTYDFRDNLKSEIDEWFERAPALRQQPPASAQTMVQNLVQTQSRFLMVGDAQALSDLSALFGRYGKRFEFRLWGATSLADLRDQPVVLVGAFNNDWTLTLTSDLRFYFQREGQVDIVRDRSNPGHTAWQVVNDYPDWNIDQDYAIVSRVFDETTEQMFVVAAGITDYGTRAAGEFLTSDTYLSAVLKQAPDDWDQRNMQVVLSTKVMRGASGPPNVEAVHVW